MTTESLKQYFKTNLESSSGIDENLDLLINASSSENPFDDETTKQIIKLINDLRVVDPAVGSGAFPMAMLNKLVFILSKLDPDNTQWKQSQIDGVKKSVSDSVIQRKLIEQIERQFKEKNADYGRKLYLIEKCIYGVDIQQIAVEIAKLRFFISLLVDEKIDFDDPENNYGIEPLPNLEFKLMQGNSLISTYVGIDFNDKEKPEENLLFDNNEPYEKLIKDFEELKHQYQNEPDNETKKELRDKIDKAIIKIFEEKISEHFPELKRIEENAKQFRKEEQRKKYITEEKQKLTKKLGFDIEQVEKDLIAYTEGRKAKDFFLWNVYFAEVFSQKARPERSRRGGFDVVIGNPPWGAKLSKQEKTLLKETYPTVDSSTPNSFAYFCGVGQKLSSNSLTYILPDSILIKDYKKTRKLLKDGLIKIAWYLNTGVPEDFKTFTYVEHDVCILFINNHNLSSKCFIEKSEYEPKTRQIVINKYELNKDDFIFPEQEYAYNLIIRDEQVSIYKQLRKLDELGKAVQIHEGIHTGNARELLFHKTKINKYCKPLYYGAKAGDKVENYSSKRVGWFIDYRKEIIKKELGFYASLRDERIFTNPKLYITRTGNPFKVFYDKENYASNNFFSLQLNSYSKNNEFILKSILPIVLSRFTNYFIRTFAAPRLGSTFTETKIFHLLKIPLPKEIFNNVDLQKSLITLVDKIITQKEAGEDTTAEERQIDFMVYKLYELTYDEVKIVDPEFALTKKEYENYE